MARKSAGRKRGIGKRHTHVKIATKSADIVSQNAPMLSKTAA